MKKTTGQIQRFGRVKYSELCGITDELVVDAGRYPELIR